MTDLVQKFREALAKYHRPIPVEDVDEWRKHIDFIQKFRGDAPQWLSEAADEIERLKAAPLRLQADRLMLEVERLEKGLTEINDLYDRTYNVNIELSKKVAELQGDSNVR